MGKAKEKAKERQEHGKYGIPKEREKAAKEARMEKEAKASMEKARRHTPFQKDNKMMHVQRPLLASEI